MNFPLLAFQNVSAQNPWTYLVFGLIGFAFGFVLEMSGFGNSRKLAAQFYFKDLTVLKVMFTAVITAMTLLFLAVGLGILDYSQVWVNPTYLWPGILGGLIMGVGFIIGGFCPTTSLASASTGKIDGMFFMLGGFVGAFLFGETERFFTYWHNNVSYYGRVTLMDVFGLPAGVIVLMVVLMALFMFWGAEQLERIIGKKDMSHEPRWRLYGAGGIIALALVVLFLGTPTTEAKYRKVTIPRTVTELQADGTVKEIQVRYAAEEALQKRLVQISPAELFKARYDQKLKLTMIDVRSEAQYNLFHLRGALNLPLETLKTHIPELLATAAPNAVYVVMSNDETLATEAWRLLVAEGVPNVYLLEGGLNAWIAFFGANDPQIQPLVGAPAGELHFTFPAALGDRYPAADPDPIEYEHLEFEPKIQLQIKRDKSGGGCG
ncbi:MAG: YeeE/YedE thiosulfate transporter family protein [Anaerolineales bacterium]|nr:YeeE/YedE thiosulfate transporter family protein [Anaerolineales bacterium]MCX7754445.1 YeeE/YedE thiosulfate transporter family protein [Anaerolineales bacterium]MDW8276559.1 YeeE/YedE thiosulfate transporter family protein [Anaerolineales bacterium]